MTNRDLTTLRAERQIRLASAIRYCDGQGLKRLTSAALAWLNTNHSTVNALNVFPVPDGDTGTNMLLTVQAAWNEIAESGENNVAKIAHAVAHGALMGARGNSGVILSQIWRGFARGLDNAETFDADALVSALQEGRDTAYRGVGKPVEGTILTVIRETTEAVTQARAGSADLRHLLECAVSAAQASVARTPELLPVLKQAGVVDAGGKGLAFLLEGMLRYLRGQPLDQPIEKAIPTLSLEAVGAAMTAVEPGQEWETVVDFRPNGVLNLQTFYTRLDQMGTSIQVGEGDGLYRVHVHLLKTKRYEPIELAEEYGTVVGVHMENLVDQMEGQESAPAAEAVALARVEPGQIGVIAVSPGIGLSRVLGSLGVASIVSGGQTMNPSTQDILDAIGGVSTNRLVVLPNNKNIILAAQQAAELSAKQVRVVPTRTVPQGIAAMLNYTPEGDLETVRAAMEKAAGDIETGEITTATRTVEIDGVAVQDGQIIGLHNGALKVAGDGLPETLMRLLEVMGAGERELITLYYGAEVTEQQAEAQAEAVRAAYPGQQVEIHRGGQPHYHYILSSE
ncbi:MAG TPA: DAK2 domain-containing protein [Anaerolineales bacterium]|nr:DAK2 domain-containing protein [Anaerolineales bacterium]